MNSSKASQKAYKDLKVTVLGFGRSGGACAKRLASLGAKVFVSEKKTKDGFDRGAVTEMERLGVPMEFGGHTDRCLDGVDLIILSPGVHRDIPILQQARAKKIRSISEIEFAYSLLSRPIIAVTGTNGKTTTTTLIGEMLKGAGKKVSVAGNIGYPLSAIDDHGLDYVVAEISSYQLEAVEDFKPYISVMLNITEDHLERHKTMKEYALLKARIFCNQGEAEYFVYNADDPYVSGLARRAKAKLVPFSKKAKLRNGFFVDNGSLVNMLGKERGVVVGVDEIFIKGEHNVENALAASCAASLAGVPDPLIAKTLKNFKGVPHRIEYVASIGGISFYNDSKGTNPESTVVALRALKDNVILIAGGRDKGGDLSNLADEARRRAKAMVLIGEAKERFKENFDKMKFGPIYEASTMEDAVKQAFRLGVSGDKVLLSPACASFDMFRDYEHRGDVFKKIVLSMGEE